MRVLLVLFSLLLFNPFNAAHAQTAFDASGANGGSIIPGYDNRACGGGGAPDGAIRYNSAASCAEFCDGTDWTCPSSGGGGVVTFADVTDVGTSVVRNTSILKAEISGSETIGVSGDGAPEYRICNDGECNIVNHNWAASDRQIDPGEHFQMRMTSSSSTLTEQVATLGIGASTLSFSVTTGEDMIVFVTSTQHNGNLGGVSGADSICTARASSEGLSGTFMAWISTDASNDPESRFTRSNNAYRLLDGTKIADNWDDLVDGTIDNSINVDETGALSEIWPYAAWTNVNADGTNRGSQDCSNFSGTGGSGAFGRTGDLDSGWADYGAYACSTNLQLYCFQQ